MPPLDTHVPHSTQPPPSTSSPTPPTPSPARKLDARRIATWAIAACFGVVVITLLFILLRSAIQHYAFDQGATQVNTMNLPAWASTPVSWIIGGGLLLAVPALIRLCTTGTVSAQDCCWLAAVVCGALIVNFVSAYNTPKREGCDEVAACFGSQGQPLRWYSVERDGLVVLWNKGGHHPTRNVPLLPITAEVVARWQARPPLSAPAPKPNAVVNANGGR